MAETNNIQSLVDKGILFEIPSGSLMSYLNPEDDINKIIFEFYVYDINTDEMLESAVIKFSNEWNISIFVVNNKLWMNPGVHLRELGYSAGVYKIKYKFFKNLVGSQLGYKISLKRISPSRTEVELIPPEGLVQSQPPLPIEEEDFPINAPVEGELENPNGETSGSIQADYINFVNSVNTNNGKIRELKTYLNLGNDKTYLIINAKDPVDFDLLLKLYQPLQEGINEYDKCWISEELIPEYSDKIVLYTGKEDDFSNLVYLRSPNIDYKSAGIHFRTTPLENFETLITTNREKKNEIIRYYLSSSIIEGIDINLDYRQFENFVKFSSVKERLQRFRQKMINIESYESKINLYTSESADGIASASQGNTAISSSIDYFRNLKLGTINEFDNYDRYLYYVSSSYESSSVGEFYESTWPKYTNAPPYYLYSYSSSQAILWYNGMIDSASIYDNMNKDVFSNFVPLDMQLDDQNKDFVKFINMTGHYYDLVNGYINKMPAWHYKDNSINDGIPKELIIHAVNHYGFDLRSGQTLKSLDDYIIQTSSDFTFTNYTASTISVSS